MSGINNTPYRLITKWTPNIAKLHVFGSVCYSYIQDSKKLDARSRKGYFVGYNKESLSIICGALRDLVAFAQFKKREKHLRRSVNFSKVAG